MAKSLYGRLKPIRLLLRRNKIAPMHERNRVFILTCCVSMLVHVPLYSWVAGFYFTSSPSAVKQKPCVQPSFTYIPNERKVIVSRPSIPSHLNREAVSSAPQAVAERNKAVPVKKTVPKKDVLPEKKQSTPVKKKKVFKPIVENIDLGDTLVRKAFLNYYDLLSTLIGRFAVYPILARDKNIDGTAYISFVLHNNGVLGEVVVRESSGYAILDKAAISAVQNAAPFPPLPDEIKKDKIRLSVPIAFEISS